MTTTSHRDITVRLHQHRADAEVMEFSVGALIIAGIAGILGTSAVLYGAPALGLPRIDVVGLLGTIFTPGKLPSIITGSVLWVGIGLLFAILYVGLWTHGVGRPGIWWGLLFGLVHGNLVMLMFPLLIAQHPLMRGAGALPIEAGICVVLAHLVFGFVVALVYRHSAPVQPL